MQDRRRQLWANANHRHWRTLEELNVRLENECKAVWAEMRNPDCQDLTL